MCNSQLEEATMPNCFTLTRKGETKPASLNGIDEELCQHLGVPVHPTRYLAEWFNTIGFAYACGKTMDQVVTIYRDYYNAGAEEEDRQRLEIAEYLREHYTTDTWCERY
jgi:hypothetical protein